ncbi:hypothetical protein [Paracoccus litorisediminis]|uniref:Sialate O-acetylesterase domain-containing protein n=1 Tax=Paracoccus litorisediminis TaxID=2006130 RepID=A0A844HVD8_9RHOB|nr:hypothetical protein [Paracoccus litorisediminis]MTH61452.1 hypothetical protein [Paracoccus litorisediminis]
MSFTSESNAAYVNGAPVSKASIRTLWAAVDGIVTNGGKVFYTRAEAVSFGQVNLPSIISRILVANSDYLEVRGAGATDDQLFITFPNWGVLARFPRKEFIEAMSSAGDTLSLNTSSSTAQNLVATIPSAQAHISMGSVGVRVVFGWVTSNTGADPTITIGSDVWTIKSRSGAALAAADLVGGSRYTATVAHVANKLLRLAPAVQIADINGLVASFVAQNNTSVAGDTIALVNDTTSANALTCSIPAAQAHIPFNVTNQRSQVTWPNTNTSADPTITLGGLIYTLKNRDGNALAAGDLQGGRRLTLVNTHTTNRILRVVEALQQADINGLAPKLTSLTNASNQGDTATLRTSAGGTAQAITCTLESGQSTMAFQLFTAFEFTWTTTNTGPDPTITLASLAYTIKNCDGNALAAGDLKGGVRYRAWLSNTSTRVLRLIGVTSFADLNGTVSFGIGEVLEDGSRDLLTITQDATESGTPETRALIRAEADGLNLRASLGMLQDLFDRARLAGLLNGDSGSEYSAGLDYLPAAATMLDRRVAGVTQKVGDAGIGAAARYTDTAHNGAWSWLYERCSIVIALGQSNGLQPIMLGPLEYNTAKTPAHVLMPNDQSGTAGQGGLRGWDGLVPTVSFTALVPAVSNGAQSSAEAFASAANALDPRGAQLWLAGNESVGGAGLRGTTASTCIWKTTTEVRANARTNTINKVTQMIALSPVPPSQIVLMLTHGETNRRDPMEEYRDDLVAYMNDVEADLAFTGLPILWLVDQVGGNNTAGGNDNGSDWPSKRALFEACAIKKAAESNCIMIGPRYHLKMGTAAGGAPDTIHHGYHEQIRLREMHAAAYVAWVRGVDWYAATPVSAVRTGQTVVVSYDSITPLVIDPDMLDSGVAEVNHGFFINQGAGTLITSVEQAGPRSFRLTLDRVPPADARVAMTWRRPAVGEADTRYTVGAGSIREAWSQMGPISGDAIYRPMISLPINITVE